MAKPTAHSTPAPADDRNLVTVDDTYVAPGFEDRIQLFWEKNSKVVITAIIVVALVIIARGVLNTLAEQRELATQADYAAATDNDALKAFIASHEGHTLAGVASLRLADEAYAAGDYTAATTLYNQASSALGDSLPAGRARLGAAVSTIQAGQTAEGEAALALVADETGSPDAIRAQAAYHLAVTARAAGNTAEAARRAEQVTVLAADGIWSQQAMRLRASLPTPSTPAATDTATETTPEPVAQ